MAGFLSVTYTFVVASFTHDRISSSLASGQRLTDFAPDSAAALISTVEPLYPLGTQGSTQTERQRMASMRTWCRRIDRCQLLRRCSGQEFRDHMWMHVCLLEQNLTRSPGGCRLDVHLLEVAHWINRVQLRVWRTCWNSHRPSPEPVGADWVTSVWRLSVCNAVYFEEGSSDCRIDPQALAFVVQREDLVEGYPQTWRAVVFNRLTYIVTAAFLHRSSVGRMSASNQRAKEFALS
jgi:hypothetical protein